MNIPNQLTLLRIALIPVYIICLYIEGPYRLEIAAAVFLIAYMTDILDGRLARKNNQVTKFGKLMDPIADKLLTFAAFVMLIPEGLVSPIAAVIVVAREFIISGFRLVAIDSGKIIAASFLGKLKTVSQCLAVIVIMLWPAYAFVSFPLDQVLLWISVAITVWSGVDYLVKNRLNIDFK